MLPFAIKVVWFCLSLTGETCELAISQKGYLSERVHRHHRMLGSTLFVFEGHWQLLGPGAV